MFTLQMTSSKTPTAVFVRIAAIIIHLVLNFIVITKLTNYDISGSWLVFVGFVIAVFGLIYLFLRHLVSFIHFIKN